MELNPDFARFSQAWRDRKNSILRTTYISDTETPVSAMHKLSLNQQNCFLLESVEGGTVRGRYSIIGREPDLIWKCDSRGQVFENRNCLANVNSFLEISKPPLEALAELLDECRIQESDPPQPMAAGLFGYLGYEMATYVEKLPEAKHPGLDLPKAFLLRPTLLVIFDQIENRFTLVTPVWFDKTVAAEVAYRLAETRLTNALRDLKSDVSPKNTEKLHHPPLRDPPHSNTSEVNFYNMVSRAKEYIAAGDIFQIVLSQRISMPFSASPFSLYRSLRRHDPSPFLFFFDFGSFSIVGSSPEILVRVRDGTITIRPIAGTRPRGIGNQSDQELEADLLSDPKELAEHLMLLDLGRNDVGRFSKIGSVKVTAKNTVEHYRHVMHIVSNVEGQLDPRYTPIDAVMGGFPAGTVSGAPKIRAMEIIAELEPDRRGVYAGCVGYFGANGNVDTCIAIRTAVVKDGQMHIQAGAGIVYDSDPASEYRECMAKARGLLKAAEDAL